MQTQSFLLSVMAAVVLPGAASASGIAYTCAANIDTTQAGTCAYLNSTVAGYYSTAFSNANASIYIRMGNTGLGASNVNISDFSYSDYLTALAATASGDQVDALALANLTPSEPNTFNGGDVQLTSALGAALGFQPSILAGLTSTGGFCTRDQAGCYDGIITVSNSQPLYWDQNGGSQPAGSYDFYSVVQHETDEVLGTISCVATTSGLFDACGGSNITAVDLFRYSGPNARVFLSSTPTPQFFSYDGGNTNGAAGANYNTAANGQDYADFLTNCAHVQDAVGCLGGAPNILTDGNAEINILDAVGYNVAAPEPGSVGLFVAGMLMVGVYRARRRA